MVVVDYAHTDDALRNVIAVARGMKPKRVITLFGCGGDRDRTKRPLMGMAAAELSDFVVLTSDNPRIGRSAGHHERRYGGAPALRHAALCRAGPRAAPSARDRERRAGDIVILAGKGHETYQILKDGPIPFDDREVARGVLRPSATVSRSGTRQRAYRPECDGVSALAQEFEQATERTADQCGLGN